jgi:hypothetical protein
MSQKMGHKIWVTKYGVRAAGLGRQHLKMLRKDWRECHLLETVSAVAYCGKLTIVVRGVKLCELAWRRDYV